MQMSDWEAERGILDRDSAKEGAADLISRVCPTLERLVNMGTVVVAHSHMSRRSSERPAFPIIASYLHAVDMVDGVHTLLSEAVAWPTIPLARSAFEALLAIDYLTTHDSDRRCAAWWVSYHNSAVRRIKRLDRRTEQGKQFIKAVQSDKTFAGWGEMDTTKIDLFYSQSEVARQHPDLREAFAEYERTENGGRRPPWYALFAGPRTIADLARHLNREAQYDALYRRWSDIVHPNDLTRYIVPGSGPDPLMTPLRDPKIFLDVAFHTAMILCDASARLAVWFGFDSQMVNRLNVTSELCHQELRQAS